MPPDPTDDQSQTGGQQVQGDAGPDSQAQNPPQTPPRKPSPYPQEPSPEEQQYPNSQQQYPADGQNYPAQPQPYPQQGGPGYPPPPNYPPGSYQGGYLGWVPQGMEALARTAAFHTDFTFDRTMLQLASGMWEGPVDPQTASAISRLDGISVHSYHYAAPGMYDPRLMDVVRRQYSALGWQHLVTARSASTGGTTDLWISFHHLQATGAVVLFQSGTNLNLIAFSGNLSPLDLLHLRGHFGIPRFAGDHFVPAPGQNARAAAPAQSRY
jgi:hypothetical protein